MLILVGRAIPGPRVAEEEVWCSYRERSHCGSISSVTAIRYGIRPSLRAIRMRNGRGVGVNCDYHPDPLVESVRWQLHEAKAMQAVGRARAVNRTEDTPLDIDILGDIVLPLTVDEAGPWDPPFPDRGNGAEGHCAYERDGYAIEHGRTYGALRSLQNGRRVLISPKALLKGLRATDARISPPKSFRIFSKGLWRGLRLPARRNQASSGERHLQSRGPARPPPNG